MPLPLETQRLAALKQLAAERFGEITPAEEGVLALSASTEDQNPPALEERPPVRAAFLRWVATDKDAADHIDPLGLRVCKATIAGDLNLDFCRIPFPLTFDCCAIESELSLRSAELPALYFFDCLAKSGFAADGIHLQGSLFLKRVESEGEFRLVGAQIGGGLECSGATLKATGDALSADGARITGTVFLNSGFTAEGKLSFLGAQIGGNLECSRATLKATGKALSADRAKITGSVFLADGFTSEGELRFLGTQIGGNLDCSGATLKSAGKALSADRANITGTVFLNSGFTSEGEVRFLGAQIGSNLDCSGATLKTTGDALTADGARITGDVFLISGFTSQGKLCFTGAQIGGSFEGSSAQLKSVVLQDVEVKGTLYWIAVQAHADLWLDLNNASVHSIMDDLASLPSQGNLILAGLEYCELNSRDTTTPEHIGRRTMAGPRSLNAAERIQWLQLQDERYLNHPQPWMQLARHFKEKDDIEGYRLILREYRVFRARSRKNPIYRLNLIVMAYIDCNPWLILRSFLLLLFIGTVLYWWAAATHAMLPANIEAWSSKQAGLFYYPRFNPFVYSLENELPFVKFGIDDKWGPNPQMAASPDAASYWVLVIYRWVLIAAGWLQGIALTIAINRRFRE